jgi:hypothetical protein
MRPLAAPLMVLVLAAANICTRQVSEELSASMKGPFFLA